MEVGLTPLIFYRCAKCRREYSSSGDAEKCEAAHLTVVEAHVRGYGIYPYPYELEVTSTTARNVSILRKINIDD